MKVFDFDPRDYADAYRDEGYVHIREGMSREFHAALWKVFSPVESFAVDHGPDGLPATVKQLFPDGDQDLYDAIDDELSEVRQSAWQNLVLGSGYVTREMEHRKDSPDWVQLRYKTRMFSAERLDGSWDEQVQQDARHFQWSGTNATFASDIAVGAKVVPIVKTDVPGGHTLTASPGVKLTASGKAERDQRGYNAGSQWRYVSYQTDTVRYRLKTRYTVDVFSDVKGVPDQAVHKEQAVYVRIPVREVERFENLLARVVAKVEERLARKAFRDDVADRIRDEAPAEIVSDGEQLFDLDAPIGIELGKSRGSSVVDIVAGAEDLIPTILYEIGKADKKRTWTGPPRTRRQWLHLERELGTLYTNDVLVSLSNQLISTSVGHTAYRMVGSGYERLKIDVKWQQDARTVSPPVIDRINEGRIDHNPIGFSDFWNAEKLTSTREFGIGFNAKVEPDKKKSHLKAWTGEIGYGYQKSRTDELTIGQAASVSMGSVYSGPLRSVKTKGGYRVRIRLDLLEEVVSGSTGAALGQYVGKKTIERFTGGESEGGPGQSVEPDDVVVPGMLRYQVPETVMLPSGRDLVLAGDDQHRERNVGQYRRNGAAGDAGDPARMGAAGTAATGAADAVHPGTARRPQGQAAHRRPHRRRVRP